MSLKLNSSGGGSVTLQEPVTASDLTLNLPATLGGTGNSMAVTSDASGNVGIGTNSPTSKLDVLSTAGSNIIYSRNTNTTSSDSAQMMCVSGAVTLQSYAYNFAGEAVVGTLSNHPLAFRTNAAERMRLDASGNLLVGTTSAGVDKVRISASHGSNANLGLVCADDVNGTYIAFRNSAATQIGSVSRSGTSSVAYNTSSDYRLKQNIAPMTGALAKVAALKPVTYKWKVDGSDGEGFIAHELQEVVPDAVTGAKDAVDADGKPVYQGIDTSFLVATLTAALQELKAELDTVKAELAAMKGTA